MKEKGLSIVFVSLLFFFLLFGIIVKDNEISIKERRKLTTVEDLKKDTLGYLEKYLSDQFPLRNAFLSFYSFLERYILGNKENNDIYIEKGYLIEKNYPLNEKSIDDFVRKLNIIYENNLINSHVYYAVIPDKSYFLDEKGVQKLNFEELLDRLKTNIKIPYIDLISLFSLEDYYKTDIHLKQKAFDVIIKELGKNLHFSLQDISWKVHSFAPFYGASYAKSSFFIKPDYLVYYTNEWTDNAKVWHLEFGEKKVYDEDKLKSLDSYNVFLSGPSSFIEIFNSHSIEDKELILFRDSFGSSLAPLLLPYYKKITLIDLRYISMEEVQKNVTFEGKDVLFLYSTLLINQSNLLKVKIT